MADPTTVNRSFAIPTRGSDPGTWDIPLNANSALLDNLLGAPNTISTTGGATVLNATQLGFGTITVSGTLVSNVSLQFPAVQGWWTIYNTCTVGAFGVFVSCGTNTVLIGIPPGEMIDVLINNNTPYYRNFGRVGGIEIWAGLSALPQWCQLSTFPPYLICDGSTPLIASYPFLAARLGTKFGGNGATTFGLPDLRGRVPLPYDGTGTRITAAVSGINGQTFGASADNQGITLTASQIPTITSNNPSISVTTSTSGGLFLPGITGGWSNVSIQGGGFSGIQFNGIQAVQNITSLTGTISVAVTSNNTGGQSHSNVQPSQVTGIAVIRAA